MKVILKGKPSVQWFLDGTQVCGGVERELTDTQFKEAKKSGIIEDMVDQEKKAKVYSEKELYAKNKDQQLKLLKKLGVEVTSKIKLEKDRVNAILEAQE